MEWLHPIVLQLACECGRCFDKLKAGRHLHVHWIRNRFLLKMQDCGKVVKSKSARIIFPKTPAIIGMR